MKEHYHNVIQQIDKVADLAGLSRDNYWTDIDGYFLVSYYSSGKFIFSIYMGKEYKKYKYTIERRENGDHVMHKSSELINIVKQFIKDEILHRQRIH
jgi:hypothetical protein